MPKYIVEVVRSYEVIVEADSPDDIEEAYPDWDLLDANAHAVEDIHVNHTPVGDDIDAEFVVRDGELLLND